MEGQTSCSNCVTLAKELEELRSEVSVLSDKLSNLSKLLVLQHTGTSTDVSTQTASLSENAFSQNTYIGTSFDLFSLSDKHSIDPENTDVTALVNGIATPPASGISNDCSQNTMNVFCYDRENHEIVEPLILLPSI